MNSTDVIQLDPFSEPFYEIAKNATVRLSAIIICEGLTEAEIVKKLKAKLNIKYGGTIGVWHGGGQPNIYELIDYVMVLARLSKHVKAIGLVIDAEDKDLNEKYRQIYGYLVRKSGEYGISSIEEVSCNQGFYLVKVRIRINGQREIYVPIAISGLPDLDLQYHMIEDHALKLAIKIGMKNRNIVHRIKRSKDAFSNRNEVLEIIDNVSVDDVVNVFKHIVLLLRELQKI